MATIVAGAIQPCLALSYAAPGHARRGAPGDLRAVRVMAPRHGALYTGPTAPAANPVTEAHRSWQCDCALCDPELRHRAWVTGDRRRILRGRNCCSYAERSCIRGRVLL